MSQHQRIFIVGHPGAGKALLAKALAEKLSWRFVNADFELEFRIGRTLNEIIGKHGEEAFYQCESDILTDLLRKENIVVTTDASIVCNEKNRQLLSSEFVIYLKASMPIQLERLSRHPEPLLLTKNLSVFLDGLHKERNELYEEVASLSIDSDDSALEQHVLSIISGFEAAILLNIQLNEEDLIFFHKTLHVPVRLPDQQAMCLKLLAQGKSSKEIARDLNISYRTVEGYIAKTMENLGCASSKELIALYHAQP